MIKRLIPILLATLLFGTLLTSCRESPKLTEMAEKEVAERNAANATSDEPDDLTGSWSELIEDDNDSDRGTSSRDTSYYYLTITDDEVIVYYYDADEKEDHLYWQGTYTPSEHGGQYIWVSVNNAINNKSDYICHNSIKLFDYKDGELTFNISDNDDESITVVMDETEDERAESESETKSD